MRIFPKGAFRRYAILGMFTCLRMSLPIDMRVEAASPAPISESDESADTKYRLERRWIDQTGLGFGGYDSNVQLASLDTNIFAADRFGNFYALDQLTGEPLWIRAFGNGEVFGEQAAISIGPHCEGGYVWIGFENGLLTAFEYSKEERDAVPIWSIQLDGDLLTPPRLWRDRVFIRTNTEKLYALDKKTGQQHWMIDLESTSTMLGVLALQNQQDIFQPKIGALFFIEHKGSAAPTLLDGKHICISLPDSTIAILSSETGQVVGNPVSLFALTSLSDKIHKKDVVSYGTPIFHRKHLFIANANCAFSFYWDPDLGLQEIWQSPHGSLEALCLHNKVLYLTTTESKVVALHRDTGELLWEKSLPVSRKLQAPVINTNLGLLLVNDTQGFLVGFDLQTGALRFEEKICDDALQGKPLVYEDEIICLDVYGTVYGLRLVTALPDLEQVTTPPEEGQDPLVVEAASQSEVWINEIKMPAIETKVLVSADLTETSVVAPLFQAQTETFSDSVEASVALPIEPPMTEQESGSLPPVPAGENGDVSVHAVPLIATDRAQLSSETHPLPQQVEVPSDPVQEESVALSTELQVLEKEPSSDASDSKDRDVSLQQADAAGSASHE